MMAAVEIPEHIDIDALIRTADKNTRNGLLVLLLVVPVALYGVGWLMSRATGAFPLAIWIIMGLCVLIAAVGLGNSARNARSPEKDARFHWPEIGNREQVIRAIEADWNGSPIGQKERFGLYYLTPNWLIQMNANVFEPRPLRSIAWAFYREKTSFVDGTPNATGGHNRTTETTRLVVIHDAVGELEVLFSSSERAQEFLESLQRRAPWVFIGHTDAYARHWQREKSAMLAAAKARYDAVQAGQAVELDAMPFAPDAPRATISG